MISSFIFTCPADDNVGILVVLRLMCKKHVRILLWFDVPCRKKLSCSILLFNQKLALVVIIPIQILFSFLWKRWRWGCAVFFRLIQLSVLRSLSEKREENLTFFLFISVFTFSSKHQGWWIFRYCKTFCRGYAIHYKILENKNLLVHVINVVEFLRPTQGEVDWLRTSRNSKDDSGMHQFLVDSYQRCSFKYEQRFFVWLVTIDRLIMNRWFAPDMAAVTYTYLPPLKKSIPAWNGWKKIFQNFSVCCSKANGHWPFHRISPYFSALRQLALVNQ